MPSVATEVVCAVCGGLAMRVDYEDMEPPRRVLRGYCKHHIPEEEPEGPPYYSPEHRESR